MFGLTMKKKYEASFARSLENLEKFEKEVEMPVDVD
jgi:hypothetical protein